MKTKHGKNSFNKYKYHLLTTKTLTCHNGSISIHIIGFGVGRNTRIVDTVTFPILRQRRKSITFLKIAVLHALCPITCVEASFVSFTIFTDGITVHSQTPETQRIDQPQKACCCQQKKKILVPLHLLNYNISLMSNFPNENYFASTNK